MRGNRLQWLVALPLTVLAWNLCKCAADVARLTLIAFSGTDKSCSYARRGCEHRDRSAGSL